MWTWAEWQSVHKIIICAFANEMLFCRTWYFYPGQERSNLAAVKTLEFPHLFTPLKDRVYPKVKAHLLRIHFFFFNKRMTMSLKWIFVYPFPVNLCTSWYLFSVFLFVVSDTSFLPLFLFSCSLVVGSPASKYVLGSSVWFFSSEEKNLFSNLV